MENAPIGSTGKPAQIAGSENQQPAVPCAGLDSAEKRSAPESRKCNHPVPGPAVSSMWATSIVWAAAGLADFVSATFRNVTSATPMTPGSRPSSGWRRVGE